MAEPFLIGDAMTGGYGAADILHACTIAVEPGEMLPAVAQGCIGVERRAGDEGALIFRREAVQDEIDRPEIERERGNQAVDKRTG